MSDLIGYSLVVAVAMSIGVAALQNVSRTGEAAVVGIQYRAGKKAMLNMAAMMDRDFRNIGSDFPNYYLEVEDALLGWDTTASPKYFEFRAQTEVGQPPRHIRYEWSLVDSVRIGLATHPLFTLTRFVDSTAAGQSVGALTRVEISLQTSDGSPIGGITECRQVDVRLAGFGTLGADDLVRLTVWNALIRPIAITKNDFDDA